MQVHGEALDRADSRGIHELCAGDDGVLGNAAMPLAERDSKFDTCEV